MAKDLARLVLPKPVMRRLETAGVYCQTWVTVEKQARAARWVLRGVESGGSSREVGRYISFFSTEGKPTALMTLEPWPDAEQLLFLIDGLRQAIVRAAEVENEQIRLLRSVAAFETVSFEPDDAANERGSLKLVGIQDDRIPRLAALLDDLEREVRS